MSKQKVAIVHDWLIGGGAERVVEALHKMYPDAPIYTSYASSEWRKKLDDKVMTGYLQKWPFSKLRKFIPVLRTWWFQSLDFSGYDLVISSSGAEAKGIKTPEGTLHVNYCHAPTHYYWDRYDTYMEHPGFGAFDWLARIGLSLLVSPLRKWDYKAAQRPDKIIANSTYTQRAIKKYYNRDSIVIHPPVDTDYFKPAKKVKRSGFVITGRQTPYKRFDLAIEACTKLNIPLIVVGDGPDHQRLKALAGPSITFLGHIARSEVRKQLQAAKAFIFPGLDDFGIAPVEAMAAGCPVIAYKDGGALDYVVSEKTGVFFESQTVDDLCRALDSFQTHTFNEAVVTKSTEKFASQLFISSLQKHLA